MGLKSYMLEWEATATAAGSEAGRKQQVSMTMSDSAVAHFNKGYEEYNSKYQNPAHTTYLMFMKLAVKSF